MWIKMVDTTTPFIAGDRPQIIEHADKVPVAGTTLDQLTKAQAAAEGWYFFVDNLGTSPWHDYTDPTYSLVGEDIHRTWTQTVKPLLEMKQIKLKRIQGARKAKGNWFLFGPQGNKKQFFAHPDRAAVVALMLVTPRPSTGFKVAARDGSYVEMNDTQFRAYAAAMADHLNNIEVRWVQLREQLEAAATPSDVLEVNENTGW